jgi:superfamily I DNA/RNA helicase
VEASTQTIPVICCPNHGPAGFKIIQALVYNAKTWQGSTALICPSHDEFLNAVLDSCDTQLAKKNRGPLKWFRESSTEKEQKQFRDSLGISDGNEHAAWSVPTAALDAAAMQVVARTERFSRLKGIEVISQAIVARHVDTVVYERRAYCGHSPKRIVTTVHGAKNREFDNVIILWPYKVPSNDEQKRRLLYNAVTRGKNNCMVLIRGDVKRAQSDLVLSLLGPAEDAFPPKATKKQLAKKVAKRTKKAQTA